MIEWILRWERMRKYLMVVGPGCRRRHGAQVQILIREPVQLSAPLHINQASLKTCHPQLLMKVDAFCFYFGSSKYLPNCPSPKLNCLWIISLMAIFLKFSLSKSNHYLYERICSFLTLLDPIVFNWRKKTAFSNIYISWTKWKRPINWVIY